MFTIYLKSKELSQTHQVTGTRCLIGSAQNADVTLAGWKVQKEHAELFVSNEQPFVRDLGSMFGTLVNGKKTATYGPLQPDDIILIGGFEINALWGRKPSQPHSAPVDSLKNGQGVSADSVVISGARPANRLGGGVSRALQSDAKSGDTAITSAFEQDTWSTSSAALQKTPAGNGQLRTTSDSSAGPHPNPYASAFGTGSNGIAQSNAAPSAPRPVDKARLALRRSLQEKLIASFDLRRIDVHKMDDEKLREQADSALREILRVHPPPPGTDQEILIKEVRDEAIGLGLLEPLLADPSVTEIMVNTYDEIFVERGGTLTRMPLAFSSEQSVMGIIERIVSPVGRRIDESSPLVDARLKDGSRFNAIIPPLALKGPSMTIRKFATKKLDGEDLIRFGSCSPNMVKFMRIAVQYKKNVIVSGGTGSGKTTLLNILSNFIPNGERIVTIEDAAELRLHHEHLVSLEARPANAEGKGAVTIRDLVRNSLRMRPDRIVVGECRGGEALDMLQAMNTGHDGSLTTAHANSPRDMLARLEVMVLMSGMELPVTAIREQVASAVDVVVQQTRFVCGSRKITKICEVTGVESGKIQLQELFEFKETGFGPDGKVQGYFTGCGAIPEFYERMQAAGMNLDIGIFQKEQ
jgi:pilus assembly protein CpaF